MSSEEGVPDQIDHIYANLIGFGRFDRLRSRDRYR